MSSRPSRSTLEEKTQGTRDRPSAAGRAVSLPHIRDIGESILSISQHPISLNGHFCDLYEGAHAVAGKVALKRPRIVVSGANQDIIRRFEREAEAWGSLRHPHILKLLGTFKRNGFLYLVSPFIQNGTMVEYIRSHPQTNRIRLLCEIADAVSYLHGNDIVHGDVKGSNVLIDDDIHSLLCDFGLSKAAPSRTSTGMQGVGALRWQSPELWTGGAKSFNSDTYAFAMTIVEVLTGEAPFSHVENDTAVIVAVLHNDERPPKLPESLFGVSYESTWEVADACWPKKPADRISMNAAFQRLRMQASDCSPEEAPKVNGAEPSGHAYRARALYASAGPPQPPPQQQQSWTNVQKSPPPVEQITTGMGQMKMQDPYRQPPPVVDVKPQPPPLPPPPPPRPSYRRPDEAEPGRYDHRQSLVAQQTLPMTQHDRRWMEREEERFWAQRQQRSRQQEQQQQKPGPKPPPPTYPDAPSMPIPDAYENHVRRRAQPPPPKAYPSPAAAQTDPRYSSTQQQQQQQPAAAAPPQPPPQQQQVQQRRSRRKLGMDDFNFLAVLGKGSLGKIMLAEEKKTNGLFAIKVVKKEFIIHNDESESTQSTKRVFLAVARERHPFLLGLHSCFQTETRVYFVMEYVGGGDLMVQIQRKMFSLWQAKFYAQEVLLALEYLHSLGIIYRDLKLDHILLTLDGHVKVADYSLCKGEMWHGCTTGTFCGTPEFMAPEILLKQKYGRAVDWWAFGVVLYQMLIGQSPFRGDEEDKIFDAILKDELLYPIAMPRDAVSILQKLLTRDPNRRLGSSEGDAEEIKRRRFFKDTNWDDVLNKRIPPPYLPAVTSAADTSNFDAEFTRELPTLTPVHRRLSAQDQAEFQDFDWVADWAEI